jgi:tetratricopeptide (TPR) repeat protein
MATKEVMVSAPVIVLLYDRTFLSGSIRAAWARRKAFYLALGSTWILLAALVAGAGGRSGTAGFGAGASWADYLRTQAFAVPHYLRLALWPRPLVFDYGTGAVTAAAAWVPGAAVLLALAGATALAWRRWPALGFAGAWFFALLAPTGLVPVATQAMAEHRMYLALAAPIALVAVALARLPGPARLPIVCALALGLGVATFRRNRVYRSEASLWADNVAKRPSDARGHNNLGKCYLEQGAFAEAAAEFREALRLDPNLPYADLNLAGALERMGRLTEAIAVDRAAVRRRPDWAGVHQTLADALNHAGRLAEATAEYREALRLNPAYAQAENGLGTVLARSGQSAEAVAHVEAALRMDPGYAEAANNLGTLYAGANRLPEAVASYQRALALNPQSAEAHLNLGNAWFQAGRLADAIREYDQAIGLQPQPAEVHEHLGVLCAETGQLARAEDQFAEALRLQPDYREAAENLERLRARPTSTLP